jgi:hypothetical protein
MHSTLKYLFAVGAENQQRKTQIFLFHMLGKFLYFINVNFYLDVCCYLVPIFVVLTKKKLAATLAKTSVKRQYFQSHLIFF